jgi:PAS domain S-box-containing protein
MRDYEGNLIGFSNVIRDVTERRKMEAALRYSEKRNALAVQGLSIGLWDWNVVTDELYWSPRFKDIIGISDQSFSAHLTDFSERLHPDDRSITLRKLEEHIQKRTPYDVEYRLQRTDGSYVWIHACGQGEWDENGCPLRMVGSVEDISERKAMDRLKDEFVAMVSHELRTPLTSIRGALGLVCGGVAGDVPVKTADLIQIAHKNSERLSIIINDILDIEKIESGTMQMNICPVDIIPFIQQF